MKDFFLTLFSGLINATGLFLICSTIHAAALGPQPIVSTSSAKGTKFVAVNGSGTTCTKTLPCKIWQAALIARAGDVVFLRGGTYSITQKVEFKNIGTSSLPVIFESYPGEKAILDGGSNAKGRNVNILVAGKYIRLRNLEVRNMPMFGILIHGTYNIIEGVNSHHNALAGIAINAQSDSYPYGDLGSYNTIRHCISSNNSGAGLYTSMFDNGGNTDGIAVDSGTKNRIENCLVHSNSDDGIDAWQSTDTYIGYNIVHSNGIAAGNGNGIKAGPSPNLNTAIEHNIAYKNKSTGIHYNSGHKVKMINNTTWGNKVSYYIGSDNTVTSNIQSESLRWGATGVSSNNSWQLGGTVTFVSTDPKSTNFLVPTAGSKFERIGAYANIKTASSAPSSTAALAPAETPTPTDAPTASSPTPTPDSISSGSLTFGPKGYVETDLSKGTLFVKPDGSGSDCSEEAPCKIAQAIEKAKGGDVVFLRDGTYEVTGYIDFSNEGSSSAPIIYESYPGEKAIFDGGGNEKGKNVYIRIRGKFIKLRGIEIQNMPRTGIWIGGTDNELDGVNIHNNALAGVQIFSPYDDFPYGNFGSRNVIRNSIISHNSGEGLSDGLFSNGSKSDGIFIPSGADNIVENCLIYGNSDDGVEVGKATGTQIRYNIVHTNGLGDGRGNGVVAGGSSPSADTIVENNLLYSNKAAGVNSDNGDNIKITNNTTWDNTIGYSMGSSSILSKNIASESTGKSGSGVEVDNSWQRSGSVVFVDTSPTSKAFLLPVSGGDFDDIGAYIR